MSLTVIVFDIEYTAWEGSLGRNWSAPGEFPEIVQIGAVKLALTEGLPELDAIEIAVRPVLSPVLSRYFLDLTGIDQHIIDRAPGYREAMEAFTTFAEGAERCLCHGMDHLMIARNDQLHGTSFATALPEPASVRPLIGVHLGRNPRTYDSCDLPGLLGEPADGAAHQGLSDARAVAVGLRALVRQRGDPRDLLEMIRLSPPDPGSEAHSPGSG